MTRSSCRTCVVGALGEHLAGLQHGHGVGQRADDVHVVVDEDDGAALARPS